MRTKALCFSLLLFLGFNANNANASSQEDNALLEIQALYTQIKDKNYANKNQKLATVSEYFLGRPYILYQLGEGKQGLYDQYPIYRTDGFDCQTFVETVLAITLGNNVAEFTSYMKKLRYKNGNVAFASRNYFPSLDWNPNNQKQNFIKDITKSFHNKEGKPVYKVAEALIDKPAYFQHKTIKDLRIVFDKNVDLNQKIAELHAAGEKYTAVKVQLDYIPLSVLFSASGKENSYILDQIPNGAIIEIVRPNWDVTEINGSHQNVSHMGFAIREQDKLIFRDGSYLKGQVSNTLLVEYLRKYIKHETIKGINVQVLCDGRKSF